ncbi:MAG TPA: hypothetical protein VG325_14690 [Solirubrobacteraceae bacterium]|jgi:hypothetical protein|nr:hypothetical protein [Solirubrobacteraceae bacterium]
MTGEDLEERAQRIAEAGHRDVIARLHAALLRQAAEAGVTLPADELERLAAAAGSRAGGALWRRALAGAAAGELGVPLGEAVEHPAVVRAHERVGAPPYVSPGRSGADPAHGLRIAAIHLGGIEALRVGERDIELRLSAAGLDVLKRSTGAPIGRLEWGQIESVELPRARRGLRARRRRGFELRVATERGRAGFELPGVTEEQLKDHIEPMLERARGAGGHR